LILFLLDGFEVARNIDVLLAGNDAQAELASSGIEID
jgi:hypothetical protein